MHRVQYPNSGFPRNHREKKHVTHTFDYRHIQSSKSIRLGNTEAPLEAVDDSNVEHVEGESVKWG